MTITLTPSAVSRIYEIRERQDNPALNLRLRVDGGGCAGFQYIWTFDDQTHGDDHKISDGDANLLIDDVSLEFVSGAKIDFVRDLLGDYFAVDNPNADSGCGCGTSFSVK